MDRQFALGAMVAVLSSCTNPSTGARNANEAASMNKHSESAEKEGTNASGTKDAGRQDKSGKAKPKVVQPSPWQPPAEIDPVPPPVEGTEPK